MRIAKIVDIIEENYSCLSSSALIAKVLPPPYTKEASIDYLSLMIR